MIDILPNSSSSRGPGGSHRSGIVSGSHSLEGKVSVEASRGNVELCTAITVSQGYSRVCLTLKPDDFRTVIDKIIAADPKAVLSALSAAKSAVANELKTSEARQRERISKPTIKIGRKAWR